MSAATRKRARPPADLESVRADYELSLDGAAAVAKRAGLSAATLRRLAEQGGWSRLDADGLEPDLEWKDIDRMASRVLRTLSRKLREIEKDVVRDRSPAEDRSERLGRDARTLDTLARTLERIADMQSKGAKAAKEGGGGDDDRARAELERRLDRLASERDASAAPRKPERG